MPVSIHDVVAKKKTDKALLVEIDGRELWVPQSQIHEDSEVYDADGNSTGTLVITDWFASKEGLA